MIEESFRSFLYPLGFIASLFFAARVMIQWIQSEIKKESVVTPAYWSFSFIGNILLNLHAILQGQLHISILQTCNGLFSWRNLNLMQPDQKHVRFRTVLVLLTFLQGSVFLFFLFINGVQNDFISTFCRIPVTPWNHPFEIFWAWHVVGFIGYTLFTSRFWLQWWFAEQKQKSYISPGFWWLSLIGGFLSILYFTIIKDPVNLIGPSLGLFSYLRNLIFLYKKKSYQKSVEEP